MSFRMGAGIAYYGGAHPEHYDCQKDLLRNGVKVLQITGCAYPEMARSQVAHLGLEQAPDVTIFIDNDTVFDWRDVVELGERAIKEDAIVSASLNVKRHPFMNLGNDELAPRAWDPKFFNDMSMTAVPHSAWLALRAAEDRTYTNSGVIGTCMSEEARPYFSPWQKSEGTLNTVPIEGGLYCDPDRAFMLRAQKLGIPIKHHAMNFRSLSNGRYSERVIMGSAERRDDNGIFHNYAVCIPTFGQLDFQQQQDVWELEKAGLTIIELHNCPYIDLARSILTHIALDRLGCDGVFFLDHDIIFRGKDMVSLIEEAEKRQDVVSAVYCMRKSAHALIGAADVSVGKNLNFFDDGEVYPALYSGLGFSAIPRAVIESLKPIFPALSLPGTPWGPVLPVYALDCNGSFYSGEDVSFCSRVQGLSVKQIPGSVSEHTPDGLDWEIKRTEAPTRHRVWLDTRIRIFHKGAYLYGIEDHSIIVPRYASIQGVMLSTREETRKFLMNADELKAETKIRSLGLEDGATHPHRGLD